MKLLYFVLIGIIVLFSSYLINSENLSEFSKVFAQSDKIDGFGNAQTVTLSETSVVKKEEKKPTITRQDVDSKIYPSILKILEHANPNSMAKAFGAKLDGDKLYVYVHLNDKKIQSQILDIEILRQDKNIIVSKLSLNQIQALANSDLVKKITLPEIAVPFEHGVSEGVSFSLADQMHTAGINGTGIKVAVIDTDFFLNNTHISDNIVFSWHSPVFCPDVACDATYGLSHGTAVAEILTDMAPAVDLYVYSIFDSIDFEDAIDDAISKDVDIITASLGFPGAPGQNEFFRDGTSLPAQKVNEAKNNQTLVTIAAGNDGGVHWSGTYVPNATRLGTNLEDDLFVDALFGINYESVMMFNSSAPNTSMQACLPISYQNATQFTINWSDWPLTDQDYDFFIYDSNATNFLGSEAGAIAPENGDDPPERTVSTDNTLTNPQDVCLIIAACSDASGCATNTQDHLFHIDINSKTQNIFNLPEFDSGRFGSLSTPADATGALTVGAVYFKSNATDYSDDEIELFSSRGPTDDARTKPEICGPDRTSTSQILFNGGIFPGTSGATPHVAGALALLIDENRTKDLGFNSTQIQQNLISDARFDSAFSVDNLCGTGSLQLSLDPSVSLTVTKDAVSGDEIFNFTTAVSDENLDGNFTGNGGFAINTSVNNSIKFTGLSPDLNYTISEISEFGWEFNSVSCTGGINTPLVFGSMVTIDPNNGEEIQCTFTNTLPTLKLVKNVINNDSGTLTAGDWNLTATFNGTRDINDFGDSTTFHPVFANSVYTLSESVVGGYVQVGDWSCDKGVSVSNGNQITLNPTNTQITCTVTNDDLGQCSPPSSGDWVVDSSCELAASDIINGGNLIVENNSVLIIPNGVTLDIDFINHNLTVKFGSGILIKNGGKIT